VTPATITGIVGAEHRTQIEILAAALVGLLVRFRDRDGAATYLMQLAAGLTRPDRRH